MADNTFNTDHNIGLRLATSLGERNFENVVATVQYNSARSNLEFLGTTYQPGSALTFDVGGTSYSAAAMAVLLRYWEQGWIVPAA